MKNNNLKSRKKRRTTRRNKRNLKSHRISSSKRRTSIKKRNRSRNPSTRIRKRYTKKMRGGENNFPTNVNSGGNPHKNLTNNNNMQNDANKALQGGGGGGCGTPCCNTSDYSYPCPDGMCGPIPQVSSAVSQNLIESAAIIANTSTANAEFDKSK